MNAKKLEMQKNHLNVDRLNKMPEKKLLMRVKSRDQLTTDFLTLFDCPRLPSETELISFLERETIKLTE